MSAHIGFSVCLPSEMSIFFSKEAFALWPIPPERGAIDTGDQGNAAD
jgi:hypothetical protein